jgi:hypothetical protein
MKQILLLTMLLAIIQKGNSQDQNIIVCNADGLACQAFNSINMALAAAADDQIIYLPAGVFTLTTTITKRIKMIGAGALIDSNDAYQQSKNTQLNTANLLLGSGSDFSSFEGIKFSNSIMIESTNVLSKGVTINKCVMSNIMIDTTAAVKARFIDCKIKDCIINGLVYLGDANTTLGQNNAIFNSIVSGSIIGTKNSQIRSIDVFASDPNYPMAFWNVNQSTIKNSIIFPCSNSPLAINCNDNYCINNLTNASTGFGASIASIESGTITGATLSIFKNITACISASYLDDYTLISGLGYNAGTDGKNIGIEGGMVPMKIEGLIPSYPHVEISNVNANSDVIGNLETGIIIRTEK